MSWHNVLQDGYTDLVNQQGGWDGWIGNRLPVEK